MAEIENHKQKWERMSLHLQVGDILTSKRGIALRTIGEKSQSETYQLAKRIKILGGGIFENLDEERFIIKMEKEARGA